MKRLAVALVATMALGVLLAGSALAQAAPSPSGCYPNGCNPTLGSNGRDISGDNWCPGSTATILTDGVKDGTATVDNSGHFAFTLSVSDGTHHVTVKGLASDCQTPKAVTITVVLGAHGGSGGTAFTGTDITVGSLALVALLMVAAAALIAGRRRRSVAK